MCLCRSNGTGVVVRRRVAADARLPVAILLPVPPPSSPSPPPTVTIFVLFAFLFFTAVDCSPTFVVDSVDGTERTGSSKKVDQVSGASKTSSGNRLTSTNFDNVVPSSLEVRTQTTTENVEPFTPVDADLEVNNQFPRIPASMSAQSHRGTASNRRFRSSTEPEVAIDNADVSTWSRLRRHDKAISATSSFHSPTSTSDYELPTTSQSSLNDIRRYATENTLTAEVSDVSSQTTLAEDLTMTTTTTTTMETSHRDASQRYTPPTTDRTTSHVGDRKRCLRMMRTGGGDGDSPATDCFQDRVVNDDDALSGTTDRRRRLEFCDAYSAYVADFDCAPSSSCLDFLCPEVVRLDRLAQSMNDQFIDRILNYDCESRYSGVWNCSACKVMSS